MPLAGNAKSRVDTPLDPLDAPYFTTLKQLDDWAAKPRKKLDGILEYTHRLQRAPSDKGKLLVLPKP